MSDKPYLHRDVMNLDDRIVAVLRDSIGNCNNAYTLAAMFEKWDGRKPGSMHLAVKLAGRRLEACGKIIILSPSAMRSSYLYCLRDELAASGGVRDD